MARLTDNLHLKLPLGSKYWNYDTWNENMKILDEAFKDLNEIIISLLTAERVSVESDRVSATNMQDAIDELVEETSSLRYIVAAQDCRILIPAESHTYIVLTFGDTVPQVTFEKIPATSSRQLVWLNGTPSFEPNSTYEISLLKMSGIWFKRDYTMDYSPFFEYYIENGTMYVTSIKADEWFEVFGNYDFYIPNIMLGYPVMIDNT